MKKRIDPLILGKSENLIQIFETNKNNEFLKVLRKVTNLMQLDEDTPYTQILAKNIRSMATEIEIRIDEFLDSKNIPFRTEVFLLILFQELLDTFVSN
ncbi:MAG: hypothetical protein JW776_01700 [Candidatus Lokiarchaeota archaeon]|nr:hypothetical protein [Candidatus Lokiarchaeota archaeon]